jgi:hypothetical protein
MSFQLVWLNVVEFLKICVYHIYDATMSYLGINDNNDTLPEEEDNESINIDLFSKREQLMMLQKEYDELKRRLMVLKICENSMTLEDKEDENLFNLLLDEQYDVQSLCNIVQKSLNEYTGLKEE